MAGLSNDVMGKMHRTINTIVVVIRLTDNEWVSCLIFEIMLSFQKGQFPQSLHVSSHLRQR